MCKFLKLVNSYMLNCSNILSVKSMKEIMNVIMGFISGVWTDKQIEFIKRCKTIWCCRGGGWYVIM